MNKIIELINKYWKFDEDQQHLSSWHDKQDLLKELNKIQSVPLPELRNKLSPISNLIAILEDVPDLEFFYTETFLDELQESKKAIEILTASKDE